MTILLVRHGETDLNTSRVVQFPDTPLGARGLSQAEQLAASLVQRSIGLILSSDYARARTTAQHIAERSDVTVHESELLRERNFGDIRGRPHDAFGDLDIFAEDYTPPGGEAWGEFEQRVDRAWQEVVTRAEGINGDVVIVTHGLVLRSLFQRHLDLGSHRADDDLVVANTSMTSVEREPPWRVLELASTAHLRVAPEGGGAV